MSPVVSENEEVPHFHGPSASASFASDASSTSSTGGGAHAGSVGEGRGGDGSRSGVRKGGKGRGGQQGGGGEEEEDDDDADEACVDVEVDGECASRADPSASASRVESKQVKKKKKSKKKKKKKNKRKNKKKGDAVPPVPSVAVAAQPQFAGGVFPEGEILEHPLEVNKGRVSGAEERARDRFELGSVRVKSLREAAEVHRQVRQHVQRSIYAGMPLLELAHTIEHAVDTLVGRDGLARGRGFPVGLSMDNIAAHDSATVGDTRTLKRDSIISIDIGVHVNGFIIDSAWTHAFEPRFDPLIAAVSDATNTGVREAGIDVRLGDLGAAIQEVMESYEMEVDGEMKPVRCVRGLCGHIIGQYQIHGGSNGKSIPIVACDDDTKLEEGELIAIETFGTTGRGIMSEDGACTHYSKATDAPRVPLRTRSAKGLLAFVNRTYDTLPFARRWVAEDSQDSKLLFGFRELVDNGLLNAHPPLVDVQGAFTAQLEHTILLRPTCKEVLSRGDDY